MLSTFIAKRIYSDSGETKKVSTPAIYIATAGMAIGLAVMIISVSVVLGFKRTISEKVVGFGSHAVVRNFTSVQGESDLPISPSQVLLDSIRRAPGVRNIQRYALTQGILKTDSDFLGVAFKGVAQEYDTLFLHQNMRDGVLPPFSDAKSSNSIVVSKIIADKLHLSVGDKVFAYFLGDEGVRTRRYRVAGIYCTNLTKYDESLVFTDLTAIQKINGWESGMVSGVEINVRDFHALDATSQWLSRHVNKKVDDLGNTLASSTIYEVNPQIFAWLDLLDLNVWLIFALMIAVAMVTMVSGLLIVILERVSMIGVLKALGARNVMIRNTFVWFGLFIVGRALVIGNVIGLALCLLQKYTGLLTLDPQTYYVSSVQIELNVPVILLINAATVLVSALILVLPTMLVSHVSPTRSMKFNE